MRTPRLYLGTDLAPGTSHALDAEQSRHISQVLRLRRGQNLLVFDGQGKEYLASLTSVSKRECAIQVGQMQRVEPAPRLKLRLWLGISKGDRMDFAIQKAVELGISSIVPVYTARSVVRLDRVREQKLTERWRNIVVNASEQSGRCHLPDTSAPRPLPEILVGPYGLAIVLHPGAHQSLGQLAAPGDDVSLLVGPEGGLDDHEIAAAIDFGFQAIRLGSHTLRTETAPLAAIAAIQTLWGEFS